MVKIKEAPANIPCGNSFFFLMKPLAMYSPKVPVVTAQQQAAPHSAGSNAQLAE